MKTFKAGLQGLAFCFYIIVSLLEISLHVFLQVVLNVRLQGRGVYDIYVSCQTNDESAYALKVSHIGVKNPFAIYEFNLFFG